MKTQQEHPLGKCNPLSAAVTLSQLLVPVACNGFEPASLL